MSELKDLVYGVGNILRENVSGWASSDSGTPHVYPDYPPLTLSRSSYPRATVDTIGRDPVAQSVEKDAFFADVMVEVTVYGVNSSEVVGLTTDVQQAIIDNHDGTDSNGSAYLSDWDFDQPTAMSSILQQKAEPGFTRYHKTATFVFKGVQTTT